MKFRTGVAALALTGCALLASGCNADGKANGAQGPAGSRSGAATAAKAGNATGELVAAAEKLRSTTYRFSVTTSGVKMEGAADPATRTVTMTGAMSMNMMMVDGQFYMKYPKGMPGAEALGNGDKWLHLDTSKISTGELGVQDVNDPSGAANYLKSAASVQKVDDKHFKGTLDLTKAGSGTKATEALGESAKAVPFEATVDDQGRLSLMDTTMAVNGTDVSSHSKFFDFGTKVTASKPPAAQVVEAPDSFYRIFNK
jgi:hypothetical protein